MKPYLHPEPLHYPTPSATCTPDDDPDLNNQLFGPDGLPVRYILVNKTWAPMKVWLNGVLSDTIQYKDSIIYTDFTTSTGRCYVTLQSLVLTNNYLTWRDTILLGANHRKIFYATSNWFLLDVTNSTNRLMSAFVVSSSYDYDSSLAFLSAFGSFADIGFFRASNYTRISIYFFMYSTYYLNWSNYDTDSSATQSEAAFVWLRPNTYLPKASQPTAETSQSKLTVGRPVRLRQFPLTPSIVVQ